MIPEIILIIAGILWVSNKVARSREDAQLQDAMESLKDSSNN